MATATIGKWGNANALRLPLPFCRQLGVTNGDEVDMRLEGGRIVIEPISKSATLKERMASWNGERYHSEELDWGEPAGEEVW